MKLKAVRHEAEERGFWAEVPALPGCVTQGDTREELKSNLREAIEGWLLTGDSTLDETLQEVFEMIV